MSKVNLSLFLPLIVILRIEYKYLHKIFTVHGDSELDEESNYKYLAHAEPVEARRAQGERKIPTNFR